MMVQIPGVLTKAEAAEFRALLEEADWVDGRVTAGVQSALEKRNAQLPESSAVGRALGERINRALLGQPTFVAAALPARIFPPLFNSYGEGQDFGFHVDNAVRVSAVDGRRVRTDLSATLFLTEPDAYDGGELTVDDTYGFHQVKLEAGALILYPASSLHRVEPVTRGRRVSSFFWIESMVADERIRGLLFELDRSVQRLVASLGPGHPEVVALTGVYHNLFRMHAQV